MKKTFYLLLILIPALLYITPPPAAAAQSTIPLTFAWDYPAERPAGLQFLLFMRGESEAYDYANPVLTINYDAQIGLTASDSFTITGTPGQSMTKYFVMYARVGDEMSLEGSNEVSQIFKIPVAGPFSLTVTVNVEPSQ